MKNIYCIFFLLLFSQGISQSYADKNYYLIDSLVLNELDSLDSALLENSLKEFHASKSDTSKVNALIDICDNMMDESWEKYQAIQLKIIREILNSSPPPPTKRRMTIALANALNNTGYIYNNKSDFANALKNYFESLELRQALSNKIEIGQSYHNIAFIYDNLGDIPKAIEYYHKSLAIKEELGNKTEAAVTLNNIGIIYKNQKELEKALNYYNKALEIQLEINDKEGIAMSYNNIGLNLYHQNKLSNALGYFNKSLKIQQEIKDLKGSAISLSNIGLVFHKKATKKTDNAVLKDSLINLSLIYYDKALAIQTTIKDKEGIAITFNEIGAVLLDKGDIPEALKYSTKGFEIAQEIRYPKVIREASRLLSNIYKRKLDGMKALEMYELFIVMRDSIDNSVTEKASAQQQAKYEYGKQKIIDDVNHEKQLAIEHEEKEKQKILTYTFIGGLLLVLLFLGFVFNRLQITKKQKSIIEKQKEIVEEAHQELGEKNKEIMDSITYAKRIQSAILPPLKVVKQYLNESFILYKPKDIVAGDFYWMETVSNTTASDEKIGSDSSNHRNDGSAEQDQSVILFAAADCTGHGVPGAMVSVICNNGLNRSVREHGLTDPGKILDKTREIVIAEFEKSEEEVKDGMDIALVSLVYCSELKQGIKNEKQRTVATLQYAGAHNPLWIIRKGEIIETKANKQPIGKFDKQTPYTTHTFELQKGDAIYIFSDGYIDQFGGEKGKKFKSKAFRELLLSIQDKSMQEQYTIIDKRFENWRGDLEQIDDVCVIGVRI